MGSLCDSLGGLTPFAHQCYNLLMQTIPKARLRSGQFAPGQSGNPGGRPKDEHRVAELARSYTAEAIDTLVELMRDGKDERVRGTAAQALLDRAWGKAKLEVVTGAEGSYLDVLRVVNERLVRGKRDVHIL
jgi:hypothetical protein